MGGMSAPPAPLIPMGKRGRVGPGMGEVSLAAAGGSGAPAVVPGGMAGSAALAEPAPLLLLSGEPDPDAVELAAAGVTPEALSDAPGPGPGSLLTAVPAVPEPPSSEQATSKSKGSSGRRDWNFTEGA
jgi:hypothetical protein